MNPESTASHLQSFLQQSGVCRVARAASFLIGELHTDRRRDRGHRRHGVGVLFEGVACVAWRVDIGVRATTFDRMKCVLGATIITHIFQLTNIPL